MKAPSRRVIVSGRSSSVIGMSDSITITRDRSSHVAISTIIRLYMRRINRRSRSKPPPMAASCDTGLAPVDAFGM